jgi:acetyltransferase-like isoleucine patch superfamily enzyme
MSSKIKILGNRDNLYCESAIHAERVCLDLSGSGLRIGKRVSIRHDVVIYTHSHPFEKSNWRELPPVTSDQETVIDDYAFIGVKSIVLPSCKRIGKHSVVGAGSVVLCDIPDYEIWAGNPAKKIGDVDGENSSGRAV